MNDTNMEFDPSSFGLKSRVHKRVRKDLADGESRMYLLPHEEGARNRVILFSPEASSLLELDTEGGNSFIGFNFLGSEPFIANLSDIDRTTMPKDSIQKTYSNHKEYLGVYTMGKALWKHLGGKQDSIVEYKISENEAFTAAPAVHFNILEPSIGEDNYDIPQSDGDVPSSVRAATTSYDDN